MHNQAVTDAIMNFTAARSIYESAIHRLEAAYLAGSPYEIEMAQSALADASLTISDRLYDRVFATLHSINIDPITRKPYRA